MKLYSLVPRVLQTLAWIPTILIFKLLCGFKVSGLENLQVQKQVIFACNHAGELDPIAVTAAVFLVGFSPMFFVNAPDKEFADSFFGWRRHIYKSWFFRAWGSYPLVRGAKDYAVSLAEHERILKDGYSLCMFPEGVVSTTGEIREGKGGVGYLAHVTNSVVIPTRVRGTARHSDPGIFSGKKIISVSFGAPMHWDGSKLQTSPSMYKDFAQVLMQRIKEL